MKRDPTCLHDDTLTQGLKLAREKISLFYEITRLTTTAFNELNQPLVPA